MHQLSNAKSSLIVLELLYLSVFLVLMVVVGLWLYCGDGLVLVVMVA